MTELTRTELKVSTTIDNVMDLSLGTLVSCDELHKYSKSVEGEDAKSPEKRRKLVAELCDARLKLEMIKFWKNSVLNAEQKAYDAPWQVAVV